MSTEARKEERDETGRVGIQEDTQRCLKISTERDAVVLEYEMQRKKKTVLGLANNRQSDSCRNGCKLLRVK